MVQQMLPTTVSPNAINDALQKFTNMREQLQARMTSPKKTSALAQLISMGHPRREATEALEKTGPFQTACGPFFHVRVTWQEVTWAARCCTSCKRRKSLPWRARALLTARWAPHSWHCIMNRPSRAEPCLRLKISALQAEVGLWRELESAVVGSRSEEVELPLPCWRRA
jgi:hypothetical protein